MDETIARIKRGMKAVGLARKEGMDTGPWEKELAALQALARAEDVSLRTAKLLAKNGWCLWKCSTLGSEIIVVCRDDLSGGYPEGYPVYMEYELTMLGRGEVSEGSLRLVHEAKKISGARLVSE